MSRTVRCRLAAVFLAAATVLSACNQGSGDPQGQPGSVEDQPSSPADVTPSGAPSAGGPEASFSAASGDPTGGLTPLETHERIAFLMPSQNVACLIEKQGVSCDIRNTSYQHTVAPAADCVEPTVELYRARPEWTCSRSSRFVDAQTRNDGNWVTRIPGGTRDTINTIEHTVLPYGRSLEAFDFRCESRTNGVRCKRLSDGRGFRLASRDFDLF